MSTENFILENLSLDDLRNIRDLATNTKTKRQFINRLNKIVKEKEEVEGVSLNKRYRLNTISTFTPEELEILEGNNIYTMADLRAIDVSQLHGITKVTKESISWARDFYNLANVLYQKKKEEVDVSYKCIFIKSQSGFFLFYIKICYN